MRCRLAVLLVLAGLSLPSQGEEPKKGPEKAADRGREAEIRFLDGSSIKATIIDNVEVNTKYGKLSVPNGEMRRIELGLHLTEEMTRKIEQAVANLGNEAFQKREDAVRDLAGFGALAYPFLKPASKSTDQEIAQRARSAMERIREKVPANQLNLKATDTITTNEFTIAGRIANASLKARTTYFGDVDLKLTDIRSVRWVGGYDEEYEVSVEADRYGGPDGAWLDTNLLVENGTPITFTAGGRVDLMAQQNPNNFISGPEGRKELRHNAPHPPGTLLGRIGENGEVFAIGAKLEKVPTQEGKLYVRISAFMNGFPNNQSTGSYKVKVTGIQKGAALE